MPQLDRPTRVCAHLAAVFGLAALTLPAGGVPVPERWRSERPVDPIWERVAFHSDEPFEGPDLELLHLEECIDGSAGGFACLNVDLYEVVSLAAMGGSAGNDVWGWTDPQNGKEYALMGVNSGTAFVDVSVPGDPVIIGTLPTHTSNSGWRTRADRGGVLRHLLGVERLSLLRQRHGGGLGHQPRAVRAAPAVVHRAGAARRVDRGAPAISPSS